MREISGAGRKISEAGERLRYIEAALKQTPKATREHFTKYNELKEKDEGEEDMFDETLIGVGITPNGLKESKVGDSWKRSNTIIAIKERETILKSGKLAFPLFLFCILLFTSKHFILVG